MILKLSWKNIWRSKRRSFVVIGAIILGVWSLIFIIAFYNSFTASFTRSAINHDYSHIQVHSPQYLTEPDVKFTLGNTETIVTSLNNNELVTSYSARQKVNGMIASPKTSSGVQIYGVVPGDETQTTALYEQLEEGTYFTNISRNPILISVKIAEKLKVKIRSKVVLTFQDVDQNITSASFRVEGIFDSKSPKINEGVVYVRQDDLRRLVGIEGVHEIGILLTNTDGIDQVKESLIAITEDTVRSYKEIAPEFNLMEESSTMTKQILTIIIMLALLFGIINTMLMAVLERTKEIGMLRSVGMKKRSVFSMIIIETCMMGILSGPMGLILGFFTVQWLSVRGLDLTRYTEALRDFGYDAIFYPEIENTTYPALMLIVILTAFIGAVYPAIKAINLDPLEAIRKI